MACLTGLSLKIVISSLGDAEFDKIRAAIWNVQVICYP